VAVGSAATWQDVHPGTTVAGVVRHTWQNMHPGTTVAGVVRHTWQNMHPGTTVADSATRAAGIEPSERRDGLWVHVLPRIGPDRP
jgi:hypothetical protein